MLKWIGWKTVTDKWDTNEIKFDIIILIVIATGISVGVYNG